MAFAQSDWERGLDGRATAISKQEMLWGLAGNGPDGRGSEVGWASIFSPARNGSDVSQPRETPDHEEQVPVAATTVPRASLSRARVRISRSEKEAEAEAASLAAESILER